MTGGTAPRILVKEKLGGGGGEDLGETVELARKGGKRNAKTNGKKGRRGEFRSCSRPRGGN